MTPSIGSPVDGTFATCSSPVSRRRTQMSVNVPPTSTATMSFVTALLHSMLAHQA
jgi:hypothetical protein